MLVYFLKKDNASNQLDGSSMVCLRQFITGSAVVQQILFMLLANVPNLFQKGGVQTWGPT